MQRRALLLLLLLLPTLQRALLLQPM